MTVRELLNDAAPWLCLAWGLGIVATTVGSCHLLRCDPETRIKAHMMPWVLVAVAVTCVAWPALVINAMIFGVNRDDE